MKRRRFSDRRSFAERRTKPRPSRYVASPQGEWVLRIPTPSRMVQRAFWWCLPAAAGWLVDWLGWW